MRVLILGGTRFIGRRIAADLVARGDDVSMPDRADSYPYGTGRAGRVMGIELLAQVQQPSTSLDTRCYVGDAASAVLAALDHPPAAAGQVFNVGDRALAAAG